jgi:TM2 domain-containing membrane protein YozV
MNKVYLLAEREEHQFNIFNIGAMEINYLDKRNPIMAAFWSSVVPGLGQLYIHRIITAFFVIFWAVLFFYLSHVLEAGTLLILGEVKQSTSVLKGEYLLMLPSIYGFAVYDAYVNTVENNKLFEREQRRFLKKNYQHSNFQLLNGQKVE